VSLKRSAHDGGQRRGTFLGCQNACAYEMAEKLDLNISSVAGLVSGWQMATYSPSRRQSGCRQNVALHCRRPATTARSSVHRPHRHADGRAASRLADPKARKRWSHGAAGRISGGDIGHMILYLASDQIGSPPVPVGRHGNGAPMWGRHGELGGTGRRVAIVTSGASGSAPPARARWRQPAPQS
jgi:hypothetical protein